LIDTRRDLHRVDRKFGVYVVFDLPSTGLIDEFFGCFGNHGEADVVQPVEQLLERRMFIILEDNGVCLSMRNILSVGLVIRRGSNDPTMMYPKYIRSRRQSAGQQSPYHN
jgi:hypothetical protein